MPFHQYWVADGKCQQAEAMVLKENDNKQLSSEMDSENTMECNGHHQTDSARTGHMPMDLSEPWNLPLILSCPKKIQHEALLEVGKEEQDCKGKSTWACFWLILRALTHCE